jgi:glycosyltransferase 2 family protein
MATLARAAGVRAPQVSLVTSFGNGAGLLVEDRIDGPTLAELPPDQVNDSLAGDLRRQVAALHRGRLAHQDPTGDNIIVDGDGRAWLVDFDQAVAGAGDALTARDQRALKAMLADLGGRVAGAADRPGLDAASPSS